MNSEGAADATYLTRRDVRLRPVSVIQMGRAFLTSQSRGAARLVLLALADAANDDGELTAYPRSQSHLAAKCNCTVASVRRSIDVLTALGELVVLTKGDGRKQTDYQITLPDPPPKTKRPKKPEGYQDVTPPDVPPGETVTTPRGDIGSPQGVQDVPPIIPSLSVPCPSSSVGFADFWDVYPNHAKPTPAREAWKKAVAKVAAEVIVEAAKRYAVETADREKRHIAHASTWLNQERWLDEPGANGGAAVDLRSDRQKKRDAFWAEQMGAQASAIDTTATERHAIETTTREDTA